MRILSKLQDNQKINSWANLKKATYHTQLFKLNYIFNFFQVGSTLYFFDHFLVTLTRSFKFKRLPGTLPLDEQTYLSRF